MAERAHSDVIVLDVMPPDYYGHEVCRRLRASPNTGRIPVLMLTARREEFDRVLGLEAGADDYVVKPFSTRELMLRIRALIRRREKPVPPEEQLVFGLIKLTRARIGSGLIDRRPR